MKKRRENIRIRNHYIPRFLIKNFGKEIMLITKSPYKEIPISADNCFVERKLYTIEKDDSIEKFLSKIEKESAKIINKTINQISINRRVNINNEEIQVIKIFMAYMLFRNPKFMEDIARYAGGMMFEYFNEKLKDIFEQLYIYSQLVQNTNETDLPNLSDFRKFLDELQIKYIKGEKQYALNHMHLANLFHKIVLDNNFKLNIIMTENRSNCEFILGYIALIFSNFKCGNVKMEKILTSKKIYLPIHKNYILCLKKMNEINNSIDIIEYNDKKVFEFNKRIIEISRNQFIVSKRNFNMHRKKYKRYLDKTCNFKITFNKYYTNKVIIK